MGSEREREGEGTGDSAEEKGRQSQTRRQDNANTILMKFTENHQIKMNHHHCVYACWCLFAKRTQNAGHYFITQHSLDLCIYLYIRCYRALVAWIRIDFLLSVSLCSLFEPFRSILNRKMVFSLLLRAYHKWMPKKSKTVKQPHEIKNDEITLYALLSVLGFSLLLLLSLWLVLLLLCTEQICCSLMCYALA